MAQICHKHKHYNVNFIGCEILVYPLLACVSCVVESVSRRERSPLACYSAEISSLAYALGMARYHNLDFGTIPECNTFGILNRYDRVTNNQPKKIIELKK